MNPNSTTGGCVTEPVFACVCFEIGYKIWHRFALRKKAGLGIRYQALSEGQFLSPPLQPHLQPGAKGCSGLLETLSPSRLLCRFPDPAPRPHPAEKPSNSHSFCLCIGAPSWASVASGVATCVAPFSTQKCRPWLLGPWGFSLPCCH